MRTQDIGWTDKVPNRLQSIALGLPLLFLSACAGSLSQYSFSNLTPPVVKALQAPSGLVAYPANKQATLTWNAVSGASSYSLYWGTSYPVTAANSTRVDNVTSPHTLSGLTNGTSYYFALVASGSGFNPSSLSSTVGTKASQVVYVPQDGVGFNGLPDLDISSLYVSDSVLYAGTWTHGLAISYDGGKTFFTRGVAEGLPSITITDLYVTGNTVYAATGDGVARSTDGGQTFSTIGGGNGGLYVNGSTLISGSCGAVSVSNNGGTSFSTASWSGAAPCVNDIAVDGSTVYAGARTGVFISTDGGYNFSAAPSTGLGNSYINAVAVSGGILYAGTQNGLSISTDKGNTFTNITSGLAGSNVSSLYVVGTTVYVGTGTGLSISNDAGGTFWSPSSGIGGQSIGSLFVVGSTVYAGSGSGDAGGLYISEDGGQNFTRIPGTGLPGGSVDVYASGSDIYAVSDCSSGGWALYISTDSGGSFSLVSGTCSASINSVYALGGVIYAPSQGQGLFLVDNSGNIIATKTTADGLGSDNVKKVYALDTGSTVNVYAATDSGLSISTDSAASFSTYNTGNSNIASNNVHSTFGLASGSNTVVLAGTDQGLSFYSSSSPGTFTNISGTQTGTGAGLGAGIVYAINAIDNGSSFTIYAGTANGISISTDSGVTFNNQEIWCPNNPVNAIVVVGSTIYIGTAQGIFLSTNGGTTFSNGNAPGYIYGMSLAGSIIYAADGYRLFGWALP